jgi:hypothetical protein
MSKQTAVEWLEEIYLTTGIDRNVHFHQAKAMEKQQMIDFAQKWEDSPLEKYDCKEDLYNETYKGGEQ